MAYTSEGAITRFRGLSTDTKPGHDRAAVGEPLQLPRVGSTFTETDTGARYIWTGSWPWVRQDQTIEPLLAQLIDLNQQILAQLAATHRGHEEHLWEEEVS
ncbi:MAG: hypothetical protein HQ581_27650 [Planctomycetes bacterium]|nr:hypothetical protein [Planctomycetota bacterium]